MKIQSQSNPSVWYDIDPDAANCTCPAFAEKGYCKHLEELNVYQEKHWWPKTHPTFSQALSALVKGLRLRDVKTSVYWSWYLYQSKDQGARFRFARRLLIGSAEDGHSVAVMERVADNFGMLCKQDTPFIRYVAEIVRICAVPNWWHPSTNGPDYIYKGMVTHRRSMYSALTQELLLPMEEEKAWSMVEKAIEEKSMDAMTLIWMLMDMKGADQTQIAIRMKQIATKFKNEDALALIGVHLRHAGPLKGDSNFLGQAMWTMISGPSPVLYDLKTVTVGDCVPLIDEAMEQWKNPVLIPGWCCDGIHCAGTDRRFAGMWPDMYAVCQAYEHYGRVDPSDKWLREFYCHDGLNIKD